MEKGFNDDELADIMSEIESLEKEFTDEVDNSVEEVHAQAAEEVAMAEEPVAEEPVAEEPVAEEAFVEEAFVEEPVAEEVAPVMEHVEHPEPVVAHSPEVHVDHQMDEVLDELAHMPAEEVVAAHEPFDDNLHPMPTAKPAPATTGGHSAMSFTVEGDMKLDLNFNIAGKQVQLNISEHGFELELGGGMKFSIPIDAAHNHPHKKAS